MSCTRVSERARREQDYYLRIDEPHAPVTEAQRLAFVRYDSHGGDIDASNPVYVAKAHYGMYVNYFRSTRDALLFPGWELARDTDTRLLTEAFGADAVRRWGGAI